MANRLLLTRATLCGRQCRSAKGSFDCPEMAAPRTGLYGVIYERDYIGRLRPKLSPPLNLAVVHKNEAGKVAAI
jgi:hypothetical protein